MFSVNIVNWVVQRLQISQLPLNILETVLMLNSIDWTHKIFQVIQILLNLSILVVTINVIYRVGHVL